MTKSLVERGDRRSRGRPSKYEIFDRNMAIAWEESVLYEPRKIDYVPEGYVLEILMEENPEFSEEEIQISFRKLNKEAERVFEENKEMMEADKPVQQEVMFWGSMAELDEHETVYDREIKVWLLEHPPSQCTRKRPAPKKKQKTTGTLSNLTEEEKAARVSDLVDSVSKGEISQEYTPDSFPTLSVLGMVLDDEIPPKVRKIPPKEGIPPKDQKKSHPRKDPLFPLKQKSIPMLLAGAQMDGPQDGPTVAEYLRIKLFAGKRRSNDPRGLASISRPNSSSVQALGSGLGHQMPNGPTVAEYQNHNLSAGGPGPSSCLAPGSGLVLGSGSCSGSGPNLGAHTEEPEEDPNQDQSPQAMNSDPRPQDSNENLVEDRDTLETSDSGPQDDSQAKGSEVSQEDLDASRLAAGYQDFGPQYDDDGAQNYFEPDDFFMDQEDFAPHNDSVKQAQEDEDPQASGLARMPAEDNEEDMEPQEDFVLQDDSVSQAQENEDTKTSGLGQMSAEDNGKDMELQEDFVPQDDSGSQAQDDEDPKASGLGRMPAEDKEEDMELQEEASDDNRQEHSPNTSSSGLQDGSQAQKEQAFEAFGSGQMPVEDVEMDSGSDLDEDPEDGLESLADTQRLQGSESSASETETSGSGAVPEMAAEHQAQEDEDSKASDSDGHNSSSSGHQNGSQVQKELSSDASGSGQMPVEDVEMDSGSDLDEDPEDEIGSLADTQRLGGPESSGSGTEASGSGAVPEMAAEHQNPMAQEDEYFEPEDEGEDPGAQNDVLLQDRLVGQEEQATGSGYRDDQKPQEDFEPREDEDDLDLEDLIDGNSDHEDEEEGLGPQEPDHFGPGLGSGHPDLAQYENQWPQNYIEAQEDGDDELKNQEEDYELQEEIELQGVQEPEPFGPVLGLVGRQDREPQRPYIELQDPEYQYPNLPELEPEPGRLSPERGTYSGIPVWEMYQRAKKMFDDLRKAALESSGSDSAEESSSAEEEAEEAEDGVLAEEAIIVVEHEERGKQN